MDSNLKTVKLPRFIRTQTVRIENQIESPSSITQYTNQQPLAVSNFTRPHSSTPSSSDVKAIITKNKIENYTLGKQLGQGAYATVRLATDKKTKGIVAIKSYEKYKLTDSRKRSGVKREIQILKMLDHPHTIKLYEVLDNAKTLNLIMEFIGGLSLHSYMKKQNLRRLPANEAKVIFRQIVEAVNYCHELNIAHRDLKLENILIDKNMNVKVIDFGFSTVSNKGVASKVFCGTPSYMAPEIVKNVEYVGQGADVWALGILLFVMTCGCFPFKGANDRELFRKIENAKIVFPEGIDLMVQEVIRKILRKNPIDRPTCEQILNDSWMKD